MPGGNRGEIFNSLALVGQLGLIMVVCVLGGFLGGLALDSYMGTGFVFAVLFLLIGMGGGMVGCYKSIMSAIDERQDSHRHRS